MNRYTSSLLIFLALISLFATPVKADQFIAMAAPYPPYSMSRGLSVEGMSVTTLSTIMNKCGMELNKKSVRLSPWAVGYECVAREPQRILLNASRNQKTEHLYKWVGPVTTSKIVLIGRKKDKLFIPLKSHLKNYRIATVRWSRAERSMIAGGMDPRDFHRSPAHVKALRMLDRGKVDLFACTEQSAPYLMQGLGMVKNEYVNYYTYDEVPLYFAFSKDTDDELIARLNRALADLKATGKGGMSQFDRMFAGETPQEKPTTPRL